MKLLGLAIFATAAYAQINYAKIEILTEQYTPNLYMLAGAPGDADPNHPDGAGGRIGLLVGPDGSVIGEGHQESGAHLFRIDLTEVVVVGLNDARDRMVIESWHEGRGVTKLRRY